MVIKTNCYESFEELLEHHKAVFNQAERISFDLSFYWFENLIRTTFTHEEKLKICIAEDEYSHVVILPMYYKNKRFNPRIIRALSNFYTSVYSPIFTDRLSSNLLCKALATVLDNSRKWDIIELFPLSIDVDSFSIIFDCLHRHSMFTFKYFCFVNWYLTVDGRSYNEYFDSLPSRLKNTVTRKTKRFLALQSSRLEIITNVEHLENAISDYLKVYTSSWKIQEPFPKFIPGLLRLSSQLGWLRLGLAYLHGQPVAAQIWIIAHGRAAIYKLAYDENFASYSIGSILTAHMMKHAIDVDKVLEVDYLVGDDAYKKDWMNHCRKRWGIIAYNPKTIFGLFGGLKQALGDLKRSIYSHLFSR